MSNIYYVRHTKVDNPLGLCYGRYDIDLLEASYKSELSALKKALPFSFTKVFSSPASRCQRLAKDLSGKITPILDERLYEMDFGAWEGTPWSQLPREKTQKWTDDIIHAAPCGGESFEALYRRALQFKSEMKAGLENDDTVLVATHKGVLWALLAEFLEVDLKSVLKIDIPYGAIYQFG